MKKLQNSFKGRASQSSFHFTLIEREQHKALYSKTDGVNTYYEAIIVKVVGDSVINGSVIEGGERMPSDSAFGSEGWCCTDYNKAKEIYENITYTPNEG